MKKLSYTFIGLVIILLLIPTSAYTQPQTFDQKLEQLKKDLMAEKDPLKSLILLDRIYRMRHFVENYAAVYEACSTIADDHRGNDLLRAEALWRLKNMDVETGKFSTALERMDELGFLQEWLIIGPFDNEGKKGLDFIYPVEQQLGLKSPLEGKRRTARWRKYPATKNLQFINLRDVFKPNENAVAYALTFVHSPTPRKVALRFGSDDAVKVWVNDAQVFAANEYHQATFDQYAAGATLRAGWNKILMKICQESGDWKFNLRITDPEGRALPKFKTLIEIDEIERRKLDGAISDPKGEAIPVKDFIGMAAERVAKDPKRAENHAVLGYLYHLKEPFDRNEKKDAQAYEAAVQLDPNNYEYLYELGTLYDDPDKRLNALLKVLAIRPDFEQALYAMGTHYLNKKLYQKSLHYLKRSEEINPHYYPAIKHIADIYSKQGLSPKALKMYDELKRKHPKAAYLRKVIAESYTDIGYADRAAKDYEHYLNYSANDLETRVKLIDLYKSQGNLDRVLAHMRLLSGVEPTNTFALIHRAELLSANGRQDEALALGAQALAIAPEDDFIHKKLGELNHQAGRKPAAIEAWRMALDLNPQDPELRERINFMAGGEAFEDKYIYKLAEVSKEAEKMPPDKLEHEDAIALLSLKVRKVSPNGLSSAFEQHIFKITSDHGAEIYARRSIAFTPNSQSVEIKKARIMKPDGTIIDAGGPYERRVSDEAFGMYYDYRVKIVPFSNLQKGDLIELQYKITDTSGENMYGDYFGEVAYFQDNLPRPLQEFVLIVPRQRSFHIHQTRLYVKPEIAETAEHRVYRWVVRDMPKIEEQPGLPSLSEIASYVHISTYKNWEEVADWYRRLIQDQFWMDKEVKAQAHKIAGDKTNELEKVVAVYDFVVKNTRYVALEFGIHSFKPYPVTQVYARKFGDCKDKASLIVAMLRELGIPSMMAIVRTKNLGRIEQHPASLAVFDHAIAYVPKYDLWLDGTAEYAGSGELPYQDRGAMTLLIGENGLHGKLIKIPESDPEKNLIRRVIKGTLSAGGALEVTAEKLFKGQYNPGLRQTFQVAGKQKETLERMWSGLHPGIRVTEATFNGVANLEEDIKITFKAYVPNFASSHRSGLTLASGFAHNSLVSTYAPLVERKYDMQIPYPWTLEEELSIKLPENFYPQAMPENFSTETKFGHCNVTYRFDESAGTLSIRQRVQLKVSRVALEDYEPFRKFCLDVDRALMKEVVLNRKSEIEK